MIYHGDCREVMATMDAASVDAIVTDPPYGLAFMGKGWDHAVPGVEFWAEALRVAKPGAHLVAFGGTRTFHRLSCAIEDAGWEMRDCLSWLYGSGFPKSLDVSKAMDKAAGAEREVVGSYTVGGTAAKGKHKGRATAAADEGSAIGCTKELDITAPATDLARQWQGWGTALKPAWEPIILARKPLAGTVAANVAAHGTGALNVDGCRIGTDAGWSYPNGRGGQGWHGRESLSRNLAEPIASTAGRWPANVVLDEDAAAQVDAQTGSVGGGFGVRGRGGKTYANGDGFANSLAKVGQTVGYGDTGGASRFFYVAKASRSEREAGLDGMVSRAVGSLNMRTDAHAHATGNATSPAANHHPTVKPIALMRWLCRLVTPPGGVVLDPFTGSGTTGCAAVLEGFGFVGIEREAEYVAIAERRIAHWERERAPLELAL